MVQHSADYATPAQVEYALRSNGGVRNSAVELLHIKPNRKNMRKWADAERNNSLKSLGHIMEIEYSGVSNGTVRAVVYEQSSFGEVDYMFGQCWMKKLRNGVLEESVVGMSICFVYVREAGLHSRNNSTGVKHVEMTQPTNIVSNEEEA